MKRFSLFACIAIEILFISACNPVEFQKKLDIKIVENNEIKLECYKISDITTVHEFIDITNKRWNKTERIYKGNADLIDTFFIRKDSIIILTELPDPIVYDLAAIKFGYTITIRNSIEHKIGTEVPSIIILDFLHLQVSVIVNLNNSQLILKSNGNSSFILPPPPPPPNTVTLAETYHRQKIVPEIFELSLKQRENIIRKLSEFSKEEFMSRSNFNVLDGFAVSILFTYINRLENIYLINDITLKHQDFIGYILEVISENNTKNIDTLNQLGFEY